jgi:hypothetical protein
MELEKVVTVSSWICRVLVIFRQQLRSDCSICIINACVLIVLRNLHYPDAVLNKTTRKRSHRHHCVLKFGVLFSSSLDLSHFLILIFHLK